MNIIRKFEWRTVEDSGTGWVPKLMPNFDPSADGILMAHDLLEHFNDTDDSIEAEFLALGSMLYLRAEPDYWAACGNGQRETDPAEIMCHDVHLFVRDALVLDGVPVSKHCTIDPDVEVMLQDILANAMAEAEYGFNLDREDEQRARFAEHTERAGHWMRRGYRLAARRWKLDTNERLDLFFNVEQQCNHWLKTNTPEFERCHGDILTVSIDTDGYNVRFDVASIWEEEYE